MDTELLVESHLDDGQRLLDQLVRDEFDVTVAFWVKPSEDDLWHFYLASPSVDEKKPGAAYSRVYASLGKTADSSISPSDISLLNEHNPIARAAIDVRGRSSGRAVARYQGKRLADLWISDSCVYPEPSMLRLSFTVTYQKTDDSYRWTASIKPGPIYRGIKPKGAVSFSTAAWQGQPGTEPELAAVGVLVAIDPKLDRADILERPDIKSMTARQARVAADEMFKSHYPDASIEDGLDTAE